MQDGEALLPEFVARKIQVQGLKTPNLIYEAEIFLVSYFYGSICEFLYMLQKKCHFFLYFIDVEIYYQIFREKE